MGGHDLVGRTIDVVEFRRAANIAVGINMVQVGHEDGGYVTVVRAAVANECVALGACCF